jgi:hypothetical protein
MITYHLLTEIWELNLFRKPGIDRFDFLLFIYLKFRVYAVRSMQNTRIELKIEVAEKGAKCTEPDSTIILSTLEKI